jgi:hypothetical protein
MYLILTPLVIRGVGIVANPEDLSEPEKGSLIRGF